MITPLKEILRKLLEMEEINRKEYWILIDDLDITFNINKQSDNDQLINLIRIVRIYNIEFLKQNSKILLFIREDMCNHIKNKYSDSAKIIQGNSIIINWYKSQYDVPNINDIPLKKMAERRIKLAFQKCDIPISENEYLWNKLIQESSKYDNSNSSFKYILDYTFYRLRDVVTFLGAMR